MSYCGSVPPVPDVCMYLPLCFINVWHGLVKSYQNHKHANFTALVGKRAFFLLSAKNSWYHKQNTLIPGKNISPCCELSMAELQKSIKFHIESNGTHGVKRGHKTASIVLCG